MGRPGPSKKHKEKPGQPRSNREEHPQGSRSALSRPAMAQSTQTLYDPKPNSKRTIDPFTRLGKLPSLDYMESAPSRDFRSILDSHTVTIGHLRILLDRLDERQEQLWDDDTGAAAHIRIRQNDVNAAILVRIRNLAAYGEDTSIAHVHKIVKEHVVTYEPPAAGYPSGTVTEEHYMNTYDNDDTDDSDGSSSYDSTDEYNHTPTWVIFPGLPTFHIEVQDHPRVVALDAALKRLNEMWEGKSLTDRQAARAWVVKIELYDELEALIAYLEYNYCDKHGIACIPPFKNPYDEGDRPTQHRDKHRAKEQRIPGESVQPHTKRTRHAQDDLAGKKLSLSKLTKAVNDIVSSATPEQVASLSKAFKRERPSLLSPAELAAVASTFDLPDAYERLKQMQEDAKAHKFERTYKRVLGIEERYKYLRQLIGEERLSRGEADRIRDLDELYQRMMDRAEKDKQAYVKAKEVQAAKKARQHKDEVENRPEQNAQVESSTEPMVELPTPSALFDLLQRDEQEESENSPSVAEDAEKVHVDASEAAPVATTIFEGAADSDKAGAPLISGQELAEVITGALAEVHGTESQGDSNEDGGSTSTSDGFVDVSKDDEPASGW